VLRRVVHVPWPDDVAVLAAGPTPVKQGPVVPIAVEPQSATDAAKDVLRPRWEAGTVSTGVHVVDRAATERPGDAVECLPRLRSSLVFEGLSGDVEPRRLGAVLGGPGGHREPDRSCCRWGRQAASAPLDPILSGAATTIPATAPTLISSPGHRRRRRPLHSRPAT
ncbi:unnamed protein product, partial [Ixodes pacificus]